MLKNLLSIIFFLVVANASAQRINESCEEYHNSRNFIETKNDSSRGKFAPVKWVMGALMYGYQNVISEHYFSRCAYTPSCSNYSKYAVKEFGWVKGVFLTADRLQRCNTASLNEESSIYRIDTYKFFDPPSRYRKHD